MSVNVHPSPLRAVLTAVRAAEPGTGLDTIARRLGLARDEVEAMVEYWERRGKVTVDRLRGCSACSLGGRSGCPTGAAGCPPGSQPAGGDRPVLIAISSAPGRGADR